MSFNRLWVLLARKYNDELTPEEQDELEQLMRRYQGTYELNESITRLKDIHVKQLTTDADEENSRKAIAAMLNLEQFEEPVQKRRLHRWWVTAAAAACVIAIAGILLFNKPATKTPPTPYEVVTSSAKSKVRLPDGSTVILNRQSTLIYNKDFGVTKREISLTGEAFFDIARNESLPLTVKAGPVKIQVLGTAFNVRAYSKDSIIETALIRGSIEISSEDDPDRTIRMRPNEKIVFSKGIAPSETNNQPTTEPHRLKQSFLQMNRIEPNPADSTINEIVWVQDRLVFSREPFYSLAQKMERWYQVQFRFTDKVSEQLSLTGSLEKETLTEALYALQQLTPFNYKVANGVVTISKKINPIR